MSALLQSHPVFQHFKVVNVAGDGDEDEESKDALAAVEEAIGKDPAATRTIDHGCQCQGVDGRIHVVRLL